MADVEDHEVTLVRYDNIENACDHCGRVLSSGQVYIEVRHDNRVFALGYEPMLVCCDDEIDAIRVFSTPEETREVLANVIAVINDTQSIESLPFFELVREMERLS